MITGAIVFIVGVYLGAWSQSRWCKGHKDNAAAWASAQGNWYAHRLTLEKDNSDLSERLFGANKIKDTYSAAYDEMKAELKKKKIDKKKKV